jgi:hypothetical protein
MEEIMELAGEEDAASKAFKVYDKFLAIMIFKESFD